MIIVGAGPAGLQATIHAARKKVSVLVLGKEHKSSLFRAHVENMVCLFNSTGKAMLETGRRQAENFGSQFMDEDILKIAADTERFQLETESGTRLTSKNPYPGNGNGPEPSAGQGREGIDRQGREFIAWIATAISTVAKRWLLVGDESAAADGALTLAEIAGQVHLICSDLKVSEALLKKIDASQVVFTEEPKLKKLSARSRSTPWFLDDGTTLSASGVFIELGAKGLMELATSLGVALDDSMRFVQADKAQRTNIPGYSRPATSAALPGRWPGRRGGMRRRFECRRLRQKGGCLKSAGKLFGLEQRHGVDQMLLEPVGANLRHPIHRPAVPQRKKPAVVCAPGSGILN